MSELESGHAFFCRRTMPVHFFSSNVSYFFAVPASKTSSPRLSSVLRAAAESGRLFAVRYAIIALCLGRHCQSSLNLRFTVTCGVAWHITHSSSACRLTSIGPILRVPLRYVDLVPPNKQNRRWWIVIAVFTIVMFT